MGKRKNHHNSKVKRLKQVLNGNPNKVRAEKTLTWMAANSKLDPVNERKILFQRILWKAPWMDERERPKLVQEES